MQLQADGCVVDLVFKLTNFVLRNCASLLDTVFDDFLFVLCVVLYNKIIKHSLYSISC